MENASIVKFSNQALGDDLTSLIYKFAEDTVYDEFCANLYNVIERNRRVKFPRYQENLRYDAFIVYSYSIAVARLNLEAREIKRLGYWSRTASRHINYAVSVMSLCYGFRETFREF